MKKVFIPATGIGVPPTQITQAEAGDLIDTHYAKELKPRSIDIIKQVLAHPGIQTRFIDVESKNDLLMLKNEHPDSRINRFTK